MKRHVLGWIIVITLVISGVAWGAPTGIDAFLQAVEDRLNVLEGKVEEHEARLNALELGSGTTTTVPTTSSSSSTTTTVGSTTTSNPPATTTTAPSTTTTTLPPPSTTVPDSTTTTLPPATTTTTLPPPSTDIVLGADWNITSDMNLDGFTVDGNGHDILIDGADVEWSNFHIDDVGRIMWHGECGVATLTDGLVSNSGVSRTLGFYPIHFHLCGDATRGSLVERVTVENGHNHAFVAHASNGITFKDTLAKNIVDDAYWWDPGAENASHDIVYDGAVADGVFWPQSFEDPGRYHRVAAFFLGQGTGLVVRNSQALNTKGGSDCSGFHWPEHEHSVWTFENNTAVSNDCLGIFIWQNDSLPHVIDGFTGGVISHGAYLNQYVFRNIDIDGVILHVQGRNGVSPVYEDGEIGFVLVKRHALAGAPVIFRNVTIDTFTVATDDGPNGGTYVLENTGLTCGDIDTTRAHPDTELIVDGASC